MGIKLDGGPGCAVLLIALLAPGLLLACVLRSVMWAFWVPAGLIVGLLTIAALPIPRKVTPEEFANELERHLQGTEGEWDWDDATSVRIADERLERLRLSLGQRFDMSAARRSR
jgi:hypothetical protein